MGEVTQVLSVIEQGHRNAAEQLLPIVYEELRKLAASELGREKPGQTLQPTALVHEAYLRLLDGGKTQSWNGRGHFFAAAAEAMRRILVENARRKRTLKRGGSRQRVNLDQIADVATPTPDELLSLDEALTGLSRHDPLSAQLVQLRYFAGLSLEQAARALGIATATAYRHWAFARAWLHTQLDPTYAPK